MKNRIIALVVGMLLLLFSSLIAQAPDIKELEVSHKGGGKSTAFALSLSVASTTIPIVAAYYIEDEKMKGRAVLTGFTLGPSIGHLYATTYWQEALATASLRFGFCLATPYIIKEFILEPWNGEGSGAEFAFGLGLLMGTIAGIGGSAIQDIIRIPEAVRKYNQSHSFSNRLQLLPTVDLSNGSYKVSVSYNF